MAGHPPFVCVCVLSCAACVWHLKDMSSVYRVVISAQPSVRGGHEQPNEREGQIHIPPHQFNRKVTLGVHMHTHTPNKHAFKTKSTRTHIPHTNLTGSSDSNGAFQPCSSSNSVSIPAVGSGRGLIHTQAQCASNNMQYNNNIYVRDAHIYANETSQKSLMRLIQSHVHG